MADNRNLFIGLLVAVIVILLAILALRYMMYSPAYGPNYGSDGYPSGGMGPGMMYGSGYNYNYSTGPGMMGDMMALYYPDAVPITQDEALKSMQGIARQYGSNVKVDDLLAFSSNYYAVLKDQSSGDGLAEVIVDRYSGSAYPEPGPNRIWDTRFGAGRAKTGGVGYDLTGAKNLADEFLRGYLPGAQVLDANTMPGYYTFDFGRKDIEGMLSVNAYSGQIWVHTWHGFYLGRVNKTS